MTSVVTRPLPQLECEMTITTTADRILGGVVPALGDVIYLKRQQYIPLRRALCQISGITVNDGDVPTDAEHGSWHEIISGAGYELHAWGTPFGSSGLISVSGDCPQWRACAVLFWREVAVSKTRPAGERELALAWIAHLRHSMHLEVRTAATNAWQELVGTAERNPA